MVRQRRRRRKIVGTDRARGQGRANEGAENGGTISRRVAIGATTADAKALLAPARTGALQLTDATRPRATNVSLQQRRRGMHEPPADGVPLRFSIRAFGGACKRPLAAVPAKAETRGFAATVHENASPRPVRGGTRRGAALLEGNCQKVTRMVPTKLFCVTGLGVTATW